MNIIPHLLLDQSNIAAFYAHHRAENGAVRILSSDRVYPVTRSKPNATREFVFGIPGIRFALTSPFLYDLAQFCMEKASVRMANSLIR